MDVCYVENASFFGDLSILARTISKVLCRSGISQEGHATMPEFMGSKNSQPIKVLLTCAGRRTSLLKSFQAAAHPRGWEVLVADMDPLAPTIYLADGAFQVPPVQSKSYLPTLLELVAAQNVRLIVPTIDTELTLFAKHHADFRRLGATPLISDLSFVETCEDKWKTVLAFTDQGIDVPHSWLPDNAPDSLPDRLFLKPRNGSASSHIYSTRPGELAFLLPRVPNPIIQEYLEGEEVTIDAFLDLEGQPIHYVPRTRIRTLGGESIQGVTLDIPELNSWIAHILQVCGNLGARGPITLQAFRTPRGPVLTEINPRFGGGFPLAHAAGGRYPEWTLAIIEGQHPIPCLGNYRRGLYMTRAYTETFTETLPWQQ